MFYLHIYFIFYISHMLAFPLISNKIAQVVPSPSCLIKLAKQSSCCTMGNLTVPLPLLRRLSRLPVSASKCPQGVLQPHRVSAMWSARCCRAGSRIKLSRCVPQDNACHSALKRNDGWLAGWVAACNGMRVAQ